MTGTMIKRVYPTPDDPHISFDDAIEYIMQVQGKTRRQAKAMLIEAARQGKVRSIGIRDGDPDEAFVQIPPSAWPKVN